MRAADVKRMWQALADGDLAPVQAALAPDAKWRAVEDGPWNCENRTAILEVLARNVGDGRLAGSVEEIIELEGRMIVAFRADRARGRGAWPLDGGLRYVVLSIRGGEIVEMKGCRDRQTALAYAGSADPGR